MKIERTCGHCGQRFDVPESAVRNGRGRYCSRACNCAHSLTRHGLSRSGTYRTWAAMRQRCTNPKHAKFPAYGGAGISVCPEWADFAAFLADMGERPEGATIDRIDTRGNYGPDNCRWATPREQQGNLKNNTRVLYGGEAFNMSALARHLGVERATLEYRIRSGRPESDWGAQSLHGSRHTSPR